MNTTELKKFAQAARLQLIDQVGARLDLVLQTDSADLRGVEKTVQQLRDEIAKGSRTAVVERVAYVWFNRFCALRFMDVNRYSRIGAVSPAEGFSQPEILQDAKQGHIDDDMQVDKQKIFDLLGGQTGAADPQQEAYRTLLVAVCNSYHQLMPFMFERIADYTELLMPDDLLSENSILQAVRNTLTGNNCQDVEVIGWLYQFYISEKKDEVFAGLKKNKKITPENIPAATQLFTPHWIVRYLAENSLGRLWMLNHPNSSLITQMDYYIKPEEPETDFLKINSPEEIKVCDPACGSGHMLTYTFDLLYAIYEEEGYDSKDIPKLILTKNLYGIEIDERAGELAAFALFMKAREKSRRFFRKPVPPNICVLENISFSEEELTPYIDEIGRNLSAVNLQTMLHQFEEADNFGSLIRPHFTDITHIRDVIDEKGLGSNLFLTQTHPKVLRALKQADYLSSKYHVVIANPPYMGGKGMNDRLKSFAQDQFENSKSDLFAMFIDRSFSLTQKQGLIAMITMQSWMFLSSFEKIRTRLLEKSTILSMAHLGTRAFGSIGGEVVATTAFIVGNSRQSDYKGSYLRLINENSEDKKRTACIRAVKNHHSEWFYLATTSDFEQIPCNPIAYWATNQQKILFQQNPKLSDVASAVEGSTTGDVNRFLRLWPEVSWSRFDEKSINKNEAQRKGLKWFRYNKGGEFRRWFGNNWYLVNWKNDGEEIKKYRGSFVRGEKFYFNAGITWSKVSAGKASFRNFTTGYLFDTGGLCLFSKGSLDFLSGLLNSKASIGIMSLLAPTINFTVGTVSNIPVVPEIDNVTINSAILIKLSKNDWDSYETSWDFTNSLLLQTEYNQPILKGTFNKLYAYWHKVSKEMQHLEEENNRLFIKAYGLQDELTPEVPLNEITLTCNPHYRYKGNKTEEELEALLLTDTMKEFLSYAVGCMFGRYSLDKPGLILANQGETVADYLQQIPKPTFQPDTDNVIPILDQDWFIDDITSRFHEFLKTTFGTDNFDENLKFITTAIGKDIRKYFLKDFYKDHLKTYKKRPIYWLFTSPKGSFNALIYIHRYRPDTASVILNDYLREFRTKLIARREHLEHVSISGSATKQEKTKALKEIEKLKKTITELDTYENETLYPLATQNIEIDLDDGVKVNYKKFGKALKKVPGLS